MNSDAPMSTGQTIRTENIEGTLLQIPQQWDSKCARWIPQYTEVLKRPLYSIHGERIMLTIEDACHHADLRPNECRDCGSCNHYRQAPDSLLGVRGHPAHRLRDKNEEETK